MARGKCAVYQFHLLRILFTIWILSVVMFWLYLWNRTNLFTLRDLNSIPNEVGGVINHTSVRLVPAANVVHATMFGPGQNGKPVRFQDGELTVNESMKMKKMFKEHLFNAFLSDLISVHRKLEDKRPQVCKSLLYPDNLPPASVVIPFRDEHLSVLLRTIYSIVEGTPPHLLQELILVDDGSTLASLQGPLQLHIRAVPKVKLIRLSNSHGVMTARQKGINASISDIVIVLDSHMEVVNGWLEPLISRLQENPKALLCGMLGIIDKGDLSYSTVDIKAYGVVPFFDSSLEQVGAIMKSRYMSSRNNITDPIKFEFRSWNIGVLEYLLPNKPVEQPAVVRVPTISGGMIAVNKTFFQQLGGFDPGMDVWGSEQMELSFKYWTCGGRIEVIPCSFVAHVYREAVLWWNSTAANRNKLRVALVWMDSYKDMVYEYNPGIQHIDPGNLEDRKRIRANNNCKPFQYYLDEMNKIAIFHLHFNKRIRGKLMNKNVTDVCLDRASKRVALYRCHGGWTQIFELSDSFQLRHDEDCLKVQSNEEGLVVLKECVIGNDSRPDERWEYKQDDTVVHTQSGKCLTAERKSSVVVKQCDGSLRQQWRWGERLRKTFTD